MLDYNKLTVRQRLARWLMKVAHHGQYRWGGNLPYHTHPWAVAEILTDIEHDENMIIAAFLHDTVEDTWVPLWLIYLIFGSDVGTLVNELTDVSRPTDGSRSFRKHIDRAHLANASRRGKTIKLADIIHNTTSETKEYKPGFELTYMREKELTLEALKGGDKVLWFELYHIFKNYRLFNKKYRDKYPVSVKMSWD